MTWRAHRPCPIRSMPWPSRAGGTSSSSWPTTSARCRKSSTRSTSRSRRCRNTCRSCTRSGWCRCAARDGEPCIESTAKRYARFTIGAHVRAALARTTAPYQGTSRGAMMTNDEWPGEPRHSPSRKKSSSTRRSKRRSRHCSIRSARSTKRRTASR